MIKKVWDIAHSHQNNLKMFLWNMRLKVILLTASQIEKN